MDRALRKLEKFMEFAESLGQMTTCLRGKVGAIVFPPDFTTVCAIGYNGPAVGRPNDSCSGEVGTCGCAHAENNAIGQLREPRGSRLVMYSCTTPCPTCASAIANCQIIRVVVYRHEYRDKRGLEILEGAGIHVVRYRPDMSVELAFSRCTEAR
jgi:deoxycytidylate deaminase